MLLALSAPVSVYLFEAVSSGSSTTSPLLVGTKWASDLGEGGGGQNTGYEVKATIRWMLVSYPPPARKMHPPDFYYYVIIPFCACAKYDSALFGAGSGDATRARAALLHPGGICRCVMYCLTAWYVVVLFAKWCFYSEFPVECYNGVMVMTAHPHAFEGKSVMRN